MPTQDTFKKSNIKDRFYGRNDELAEKIAAKEKVDQHESTGTVHVAGVDERVTEQHLRYDTSGRYDPCHYGRLTRGLVA